jgi:hypothetical protein
LSAVRRNVELAGACGASPAMTLAVALMTRRPATIDEALEFVAREGRELLELAASQRVPTALAELEPEIRADVEIARVLPEVSDHELRGKRVFRDLVGKKSFMQVAALAIDGVELGDDDARLLEHLGVNTQLADAGIWPLNVTRRAARAADFPHAVVAGLCAMLNPNMAAQPVGAFMRVLDRLERGTRAGKTVSEQLDAWTKRGERIPGVGRPALGPDERNAQVTALAMAFGRDAGSSVRLARAVDEHFRARKGGHVRINSAGLQGAIMRDLGFTPRGASAFCVLYFMVPVLAHAAFGDALRETAGHAPAA